MAKWYRATCLKEIHWHGKTYRQGDAINVIELDLHTLTDAGVLGDVRPMDKPEDRTEFEVRDAPENQMRGRRKVA